MEIMVTPTADTAYVPSITITTTATTTTTITTTTTTADN